MAHLQRAALYIYFYFCSVQGVVYQLDVALESVDTQRSGLVFIYDMSDSKYANFDYDLSQKILTLLKVISGSCYFFPCYCPLSEPLVFLGLIGGIQYPRGYSRSDANHISY